MPSTGEHATGTKRGKTDSAGAKAGNHATSATGKREFCNKNSQNKKTRKQNQTSKDFASITFLL